MNWVSSVHFDHCIKWVFRIQTPMPYNSSCLKITSGPGSHFWDGLEVGYGFVGLERSYSDATKICVLSVPNLVIKYFLVKLFQRCKYQDNGNLWREFYCRSDRLVAKTSRRIPTSSIRKRFFSVIISFVLNVGLHGIFTDVLKSVLFAEGHLG